MSEKNGVCFGVSAATEKSLDSLRSVQIFISFDLIFHLSLQTSAKT